MADRELRTILTSGEIPDVKIDGTDANKSVATKEYVDTSITTLRNEAVVQEGVLALAATATINNSLTTTDAKIQWVNALIGENANGHIEYDMINHRIVLKSVGLYTISASGTVAANNGVDFSIHYKSYTPLLPVVSEPQFVGRGTDKPFTAIDITTLAVTQAMLDDITGGVPIGELWLEIWADSVSATPLVITSSSVTIDKKV